MFNIQPYTSLQAPAKVNDLILLTSTEQLSFLPKSDFIVLGEGTNVLFVDDYQGTVVVNQLKGIKITESDELGIVEAHAGENWHDFVCDMSSKGFFGLENLALIPGTVGAAPVQNIGAYGVEVANFINSVVAFDVLTQTFCEFNNKLCGFGYRDSFFKHDKSRGRYVITSVKFHLPKIFSPNIKYKELNVIFDSKPNFLAQELLEAVTSIRQSKLPDYRILPNAGSFFKNPIVAMSVLTDIQKNYDNVPHFIVGEGVKIPAAWLIEIAGLKGILFNGAGIYDKHALIITNQEKSSGKNVASLSRYIIDQVNKKFSIILEPEVRFIGG